MHHSSPSVAWLALALTTAFGLALACKQDLAAEGEPSAAAEPPSTPTEAAPAAHQAPVAAGAEGGGRSAPPPATSAPEAGTNEGSGANAPPKKSPRSTSPVSPSPAPPPAGYTGPDPCRATKFDFASVRNACNQGGIDQAKRLMKGMVKRAKDDGKELKCSSCHDNTKTYTKKPNAVEDMRALQ